jgi:hypothetical protein
LQQTVDPVGKTLSYMYHLCSNAAMTDSLIPNPPTQLLADEDLLAFTAVPLDRIRANGWTAAQQERFILALHVMGSVGQAAKAVGMSRQSAYNLRERAGAESFAKSWDAAIDMGQQRQFDLAMERAIHGVTTVRVLRGGSVTVNGGPDMRILRSALRSEDERWSRDARESSPSTCDGEVAGVASRVRTT